MADRPVTIDEYINEYSNFRDGLRDDPPSIDGLTDEDRLVAQGWIENLQALAGVDSLLSLPSADALLARAEVVRGEWVRQDLADELQLHLRMTVWQGTHITVNEHGSSGRAQWDLLARVKGVPLRIVLDMGASTVADAFSRRVADVAMIFGAFPAESAVVLVAGDDEVAEAALVDRTHVTAAFESPSGERVPPRLDGVVGSPEQICQRFFEEVIVEFDAPPTPAVTNVPELVALIEPDAVAGDAMRKVAEAGRRARITEKASGYGAVGDAQEAALAGLVRRATEGQLDDIDDELAAVGDAA